MPKAAAMISRPRQMLAAMLMLSMRLPILLGCLAAGGCGPSDHELAELAAHGAIHEDAPVKATSAIVIDAPRERVWRILTDVPKWPDWQSGITNAASPGALHAGSTFTWRTDGSTIHSQVALFSPPNAITWTGRAFPAKAVHAFVLTAPGPNKTKIESRESMDGFLLTWFYDSAALQKSEDAMLKNLATEAQRRQQ